MGSRFRTVLIVVGTVLLTLGTRSVGAEVLTLDQCIELALKSNGSAQYAVPQARENAHRAGQGVWTAWGNLLPSFTHGYSYSERRLGDVIIDPATGEPVELPPGDRTSVSWGTDFSFRQTLFDGGANWYGVAQAYHSLKASQENLRGSLNSLVLGVKESYFTLLKAQELVVVQEAAVRRAEQFHKTIESKYELGSASLSEVLKAKVDVGTAQLELLRRQNDVRTNRANLNTIINRPVDESIELAPIADAEPVTPSYEEALELGRRESPDLIASQAKLRAAKDEIGIARATLFPSLSWSATRRFSPQDRDDLFDYDGKVASWFIGADLTFNLFDAFYQKTAISNARVGVKYARETERQTRMSVELAIKQAYLEVDLARASRQLADQTEASAQEDFNLAQEKYNLGAATILDLLNAQESLTRAQTEKVNALYDHYVAVARLQNAIGRR